MDILNTATIFRFHQQMIASYGKGSEIALGWKSKEAQLIRFKILAGIADLNHHSVLDAGCGHGDLRDYLDTLYPHLRYYGIELQPGLLQVAIECYRHLPETVFFEGDFSSAQLPNVDYIIASGSLNYHNSDPLYVFKMIEKLFNNCRLGFAFNLLHKTEDPKGPLCAYNPAFVMDFCDKLTGKVTLTQDYFENDYTIFMYH